MKYKVKNLTNDRRRFWVRKSEKIFTLDPKETITIDYKPMNTNKNFSVREVSEKKKKKEKIDTSEDTSKVKRNKIEEKEYGKRQYVE